MTIVLATRNRKKAEELQRMFAGCDLTVKTLDEYPGCPEAVEDGATFRANALKKARTVAGWTGLPALADDSGLEVSALDGAPGVLSARYAGPDADDRKNVAKLLRELKKLKAPDRGSRFVCCIALAFPDGSYRTFTGYTVGSIGPGSKGRNGFGYDPVFYPEGHDRTFAEMSAAEKDALSHRGRALAKLVRYLEKDISLSRRHK